MTARLAHLPALLLMSAALLMLAGLTGWLLRGPDGALGAVAGVALVVVGYTFSTLVIAWADSVDPQLVLPFGLSAYVVKTGLLGLVMVLVLDSGWPGMVPMGLGIAAGVVVWNAAQIWWVRRHDPYRSGSPVPAPGSGEKSPGSAG